MQKFRKVIVGASVGVHFQSHICHDVILVTVLPVSHPVLADGFACEIDCILGITTSVFLATMSVKSESDSDSESMMTAHNYTTGESWEIPPLLISAASEGNTSEVALLLSKGAKVNVKDSRGITPLLAAAQEGHTEVCKLLLEVETDKANVKETTPRGFTPLLDAATNGHTEVCELLLANGSDLEERDPRTQDTALHIASTFGHQSLVRLLIAHKADVDSRKTRGGTPLHGASQEGHIGCVVALLQGGADPLLPSMDGALPIHQAATHNHHEVVRILIEQGGCNVDLVRNCMSRFRKIST